jgi:hypothetical protein
VRLLQAVEEAEHPLADEFGGAGVESGEAVVGEQVRVPGVEEQLRPVDRGDECARDVDVAPVVVG